MNKKLLVDCGIAYDEGVEKFLDEKELYESLLVNFLTDNTFDEAKGCVEAADYDGAMKAVHAMKSVTGTLCMNGLLRKCCEVMDSIRDKDYKTMEKTFGEAYNMYLEISNAIKNA